MPWSPQNTRLRFGQKAVVPVSFHREDDATNIETRGVVSFVVQKPAPNYNEYYDLGKISWH